MLGGLCLRDIQRSASLVLPKTRRAHTLFGFLFPFKGVSELASGEGITFPVTYQRLPSEGTSLSGWPPSEDGEEVASGLRWQRGRKVQGHLKEEPTLISGKIRLK